MSVPVFATFWSSIVQPPARTVPMISPGDAPAEPRSGREPEQIRNHTSGCGLAPDGLDEPVEGQSGSAALEGLAGPSPGGGR